MSVKEPRSLTRGPASKARRGARAARRPVRPVESLLIRQAKALTEYLPDLMRQLFTFEDDLVEELPLAQLRVCGLLYQQARSMSALSRELGVSLSAMTQVADRLERSGLVMRLADGTDRRLRCLQLTERGLEIMRRHEEARLQSVLEVLQHVAAKTRRDVLGALQALQRACAARKQHAEE